MVKYLREQPNQRECMTRDGKVARLPAALRQEFNQRLLNGEQGKQLVLWPQRIRRILGLGEGDDGSKYPGISPAASNADQPSTSKYQ